MSRHHIMSPILLWICFFTIVCVVQLCSASNNPNSRIVEGIDKWSTDSVVITSSPQNSHARIPEPFSGTINLSFLEGSCHSILEDRWEYTVCPYQNVTSKRIMAQKTNLLGVWGHWTSKQSEESTSRKYPIMEYTNGQGCNGEDSFLTGEKSLRDDKETHATVTLICSSDDRKIDRIHVLSASENDCHYQFELGLPIPCGLLGVEPHRHHTHFPVPTSIEQDSENDRFYTSPSKEKASKYKGVYKCGRKWKTQVQIGGVQYYLGVFEKEEDAFNMYLEFINKNPQIHLNHFSTSSVEQSSLESSLHSNATLHDGSVVDSHGYKVIEREGMFESTTTTSSSSAHQTFGTGHSSAGNHRGDFYVPSPAVPSVHTTREEGGAVKKLRASEIQSTALFEPYSTCQTNAHQMMIYTDPDQLWTWRRQVLIGKCLFLSSSLHQLQFQVYLSQQASSQSSSKATPLTVDIRGQTNGSHTKVAHQEHPESLTRLTMADFNVLFGILDQCLASLLSGLSPIHHR